MDVHESQTGKVDLYVKGAIDADIKRRAKACAAEVGMTFGSFVQAALTYYVDFQRRIMASAKNHKK